VEEGVLENKMRPKTLNLHYRQGGETRSRQGPIPQGKKIDEMMLFDHAKTLMGQIILEGRVWPCSNISLSAGGFEGGVSSNMSIGAFWVRGDEAKALNISSRESSMAEVGHERPGKRRRLEHSRGIPTFFVGAGSVDAVEKHDDDCSVQLPGEPLLAEGGQADLRASDKAALTLPHENEATKLQEVNSVYSTGLTGPQQRKITEYICKRCSLSLESADALQSHQDWHFAKDLQDEDRGRPARPDKPLPTTATTGNKKAAQNSNKKKTGRGKSEKGQSKLAFG
jgi:DNA polymerase eta